MAWPALDAYVRDLRADGSSASPQPASVGEQHMVQRFCGGNYFVYLAMPTDVVQRWVYQTNALDAKERALRQDSGPAVPGARQGPVHRVVFPQQD